MRKSNSLVSLILLSLLLACGKATAPTDEAAGTEFLPKALAIKTEVLMLCRQAHQIFDPLTADPSAMLDPTQITKLASDLAAQESKLMEIPARKEEIAYRDSLRSLLESGKQACREGSDIINIRQKLREAETGDPTDRAIQAKLSEYRSVLPYLQESIGKKMTAMDRSMTAVNEAEAALSRAN